MAGNANFMTWNANKYPDNGVSGITFKQGNTFAETTSEYPTVLSNMAPRTGKWYVEMYHNQNAGYNCTGIVQAGAELYTQHLLDGASAADYQKMYQYQAHNGQKSTRNSTGGGATSAYGATYTTGDVIGVAFDADNGDLVFYKNNASQGTAFTGLASDTYFASFGDASTTDASTMIANFGQDSSFAGNKTAQGNTDANGIGDFYYAVPTGFQAVCTKNLADTAIGPNSATQSDDHFNTVLWSGNSSSGTTISGVGFKPDWSWIKARESRSHVLFDSSRGVTKYMSTNSTDAEATNTEGLQAFASDGVTLGSDSTVNHSSYTYVGWNWKANGGTTTTNDASATGVGSIDSVYQANTTAGFSIVTYTGSSSGTDGTPSTIAHGLGAVPSWIIIKARTEPTGGVHFGSDQGNFVVLPFRFCTLVLFLTV